MENYLPVYEKVFYEKTEKNLSAEAVLPEYLPNVAKVVKVSVIPTSSVSEIYEDSVAVSGRAVFAIVYMSDFRDTLKCTVFPVEFSHTFPARGIKAELSQDGFAQCLALTSEEKVVVTSPRKLSLSCKLSLCCEGTSVKRNEVLSPEEDENLKKLTGNVQVLRISEVSPSEIRIEENITLDDDMPQAQEIIFADCSLSVEDSKIEDGTCTFNGNAVFSCMYLSQDTDESAEYISLTKSIPFSTQTSIDGVPEDAYVLCKPTLLSVSADALSDSYGDKKIISVTVLGSINSKAYYNEKASYCEDVFCTVFPCECETKELGFDSLISGYAEKICARESVHANIGNVTDVISQSATVNVISTENVDSRLIVNARATVKLTGTNELGAVESATFSFGTKLPYTRELSEKCEKCRFDTNADVLDCRCRIVNGEVKCELDLFCKTAVTARNHVRAVTAVQTDDSTQFARDKSEYIIYYPDAEDTLWLTSKKYKVSPDELMAINGMKAPDEISAKKTLIIPR